MNIREIEQKLWMAANKLRGNMSAEEYMHVILGVLSLKYISDKYDIAIKKLHKDKFVIDDIKSSMFYSNYKAFKVSENSHWNWIMKFANSPEIGQKMDESFVKIEKDNPMLKGIFNKGYNNEGIDQNRLGEVVKIFSDEDFTKAEEDLIGRIYEFFLGKFFKDRGQKGGEFYTPRSIVQLMVNLIKPLSGKIYDPACGTAGILVQSKKYIEDHGKSIDNISVYGQEFNNVTWKLAKLNLILNGFQLIDLDKQGVLGQRSADTFTADQHKDKKFDFIMANPPFNLKEWGFNQLQNDSRWQWGIPPKGNANYAWLSHMISKLTSEGKATILLANGSLSSSGKQELMIRKNLIKENKVDAIIALPNKLFYTVGIPACIWIFNNKKKNNNVLMINAADIEGKMLSKKLRELTEKNINDMVKFYDEHLKGNFIEKIGFAKTINKKDLEENDYSFVPGRYVGFVEEIIDKKQIKKEIQDSSIELKKLFRECRKNCGNSLSV